MRAVVQSDIFASILTRAMSVMSNNPALVAYSGVLLTVEEQKLTVTASDGVTTVRLMLPVDENAVDGILVVPPAPLDKWLQTLPSKTDVTLAVDSGTELTATPANAKAYTFRALAATFPVTIPAKPVVTPIDFSWLTAATGAVSRSAAAAVAGERGDEVVQLSTGDFGVRLYSTDKFRVTRVECPEIAWPTSVKMLLHLKVLKTLAKLGVSGIVDLKNDTTAGFAVKDGILTTRVLDASFPPVESVMDAPTAHTVTIPVNLMKKALTRLACVASGSLPLVVSVDQDVLTLCMNSVDVGSGLEEIPLESSDVAVKFGVNLSYLADAFAACPTDNVEFGWTSPTAPLRLHAPSSSPVTVIVMPVNLSD